MKQIRTDYFISYTGVDQPWAEWIAWVLEAAGYRTRLQARDFVPGSMFPVEMHEAISGSKFTLAVLTPQYLESRYARAEWSAAFAVDRLIPVRVTDFVPDGLFAGRTYVDLVGLQEAGAREVLLRDIECATRNSPLDRSRSSYDAPRTLAGRCAPAFPGHQLVPLAESPAGLSAPLRGAASPLRPSSFSRGFTPNPAVATRPPSAARLPASLRHFFWRAALAPAELTRQACLHAVRQPPTGARRVAVNFWVAFGTVVMVAIALSFVLELHWDSSNSRLEYAHSATPLPDPSPPFLAAPIGMKFISGGALRIDPPGQQRPRECSGLTSELDCPALGHREQPLTVDVSSFYLDVTEVTNDMFTEWLSERRDLWRTSSTESDVLVLASEAGTPLVWFGAACSGAQIDGSRSIRIRPGCGRRPVTCVSWHGAREYCHARGNRLPTNHEWQWAARGPENRAFPWGPGLPKHDGVVFGLKGSVQAGPRDVDMGVDDITPQGIRNLGGNVAEWTEDGPNPGEKIVRGGSWASATACHLLNSSCAGVPPDNHSATDLGFRCARSISR